MCIRDRAHAWRLIASRELSPKELLYCEQLIERDYFTNIDHGKLTGLPHVTNELGFNADDRDYGIGAQILRAMSITRIRLLSNNPKKRVGLMGYGIEIVDTVPLEIDSNIHNEFYLKTKRDKMGHAFNNLNEL